MYKSSLFNNTTTHQTNYSIRSNNHSLTVQSQNKLSLNPFDDKRLYINNTQSVPWDIHTQRCDCTCILCIKFIGLYYQELMYNKTPEQIFWSVWYYKELYNQNQLLYLIQLKLIDVSRNFKINLDNTRSSDY